ncbi:flagellar biosynthesis protein FliQ [Sulfitobacter sp. R18_1]|uniref:flagellar biosynthesis protein FliQ n=1 Tax=Sulfitobacter sp. R18_1 TaxID=2821104 RepID=UPI001AD9B800|nr:flagellar biosynthesis protein FliQ [Sulfitobacter sp. R18_1]MBO9428610.1 flagellar biosynthesis protein FliQ [Sulfitobacter sp. R18_1]
MTEADVISILKEAIWTILIAASPILACALAIGLFIAFFQALTQIQEMTLTFVPKIVGILIALTVSIPFMFSSIQQLSDKIFDLIVVSGL